MSGFLFNNVCWLWVGSFGTEEYYIEWARFSKWCMFKKKKQFKLTWRSWEVWLLQNVSNDGISKYCIAWICFALTLFGHMKVLIMKVINAFNLVLAGFDQLMLVWNLDRWKKCGHSDFRIRWCCLFKVWKWHSETWNCWTILIGSLNYCCCAVSAYMSLKLPKN